MELILIITLFLSFFVLIYFILFTYAVNNDKDEFWKYVLYIQEQLRTHI